VIWRDNPAQIVEKYLAWANQYRENQVTIVYDTMWNGTRVMAENIAQGIGSADPKVTIKLFNAAQRDKNDIVAEIFKSKAVVLGSPTVNKGILTSLAALLEEVRGLGFKGKKAAVFGAYGWSGESVAVLKESLARAGFQVVDEGLKALWNPDPESRRQCLEYGRRLAAQLD
jgi:anaerobic nitric oxide reductase flavorubredoxin